jgi:hypothetical protein
MGRDGAGREFTFAKLVEDPATGRVGQGPEHRGRYGGIYILSNLAS